MMRAVCFRFLRRSFFTFLSLIPISPGSIGLAFQILNSIVQVVVGRSRRCARTAQETAPGGDVSGMATGSCVHGTAGFLLGDLLRELFTARSFLRSRLGFAGGREVLGEMSKCSSMVMPASAGSRSTSTS